MKIFIYSLFILCLISIISPVQIFADTILNFYMNDFYSKSNEASQILREIENTLKEGSRSKVCSRQREAAKLGLLANESLIKAYEIEGAQPPMSIIKASQQRWESILNECWKNIGEYIKFLNLHSYRFTDERYFGFNAINTLKNRINKNTKHKNKNNWA